MCNYTSRSSPLELVTFILKSSSVVCESVCVVSARFTHSLLQPHALGGSIEVHKLTFFLHFQLIFYEYSFRSEVRVLCVLCLIRALVKRFTECLPGAVYFELAVLLKLLMLLNLK